MVDPPFPDRYEIGCSQYIARVVILGAEYLILVKKKMVGKYCFLGCMRGHCGALLAPPMVRDGRYAYTR